MNTCTSMSCPLHVSEMALLSQVICINKMLQFAPFVRKENCLAFTRRNCVFLQLFNVLAEKVSESCSFYFISNNITTVSDIKPT